MGRRSEFADGVGLSRREMENVDMNEKTETGAPTTRRDAPKEGVLMDATEMAKVVGIEWPVAATASVWAKYVVVPEEIYWQNDTTRLWDILTALRFEIWQSSPDEDCFLFWAKLDLGGEHDDSTPLKAVLGPDDEGQPCLTITEQNED